MAEKWDYATELTTFCWLRLGKLAEATLAALEHDTDQNRGRAWHLAHQALGHETWCGVVINPAQFDGGDRG